MFEKFTYQYNQTIEHLIECRKNKDMGIEIEWLKETEDVMTIRRVKRWINNEIEKDQLKEEQEN